MSDVPRDARAAIEAGLLEGLIGGELTEDTADVFADYALAALSDAGIVLCRLAPPEVYEVGRLRAQRGAVYVPLDGAQPE